MKRVLIHFTFGLLLLTGIAGVLPSNSVKVSALTPNQQAVCESIGSGKDCVETDDQGGTKVDSVIKTVVRILGVVAGVLAVIMIIVSGIKYITSGGDSSKIAGAKSALVYAIIGLIIVALSQIIVRFVLSQTARSG